MPLDRGAVERAIDEHVARPLGMSVHDAAVGMHSVVNENMAAATRMHVAEKGRDPRKYTLVAFGGAGPVHAWGLARLLKISRIVCPFGAGVTSALGMLVAAPAIDLTRSYVARLATLDWARVEALYADMEREARALLAETGAHPDEISIRRAADMRYAGQGFEVTVPLPDGRLDDARRPDVQGAFQQTYRERFGRDITDVAIEALSWRLSASAPVPNITVKFGGQPTTSGDPRKGTRPVWFPKTGVAPCPVLSRYGLTAGMEFTGPAVIEERESTTVVGPGGRVTVDAHLNLLIDLP
jgi:N-methylhydantoinase A